MTFAAQSGILVVGSANLDFVVRVPHVPAPGETVMGCGVRTFPGGKGANQAVACARAGNVATHLLAALGDDAHAAVIEASLRTAGVHSRIVRAAGASTGVAFVCLADNAENSITVAPGANEFLGACHLPPLAGFSYLLLQLETPLDTVEACARAARDAGVRVVLNAAPAKALPAELLAVVDVLIVNEGELAAITGHTALRIAEAITLLDVPCLVVTLGEKGCLARVDGELFLQPAFAVDAQDTTAAGDTFCGVLVAALAQDEAYPDALRRASAAAALACQRIGAQASIPTHAAVGAFLAARPTAGIAQHEHDRLAAYCGLT
ncbi:MAG TPA: ribokinase [Rhodanobacter sp.]